MKGTVGSIQELSVLAKTTCQMSRLCLTELLAIFKPSKFVDLWFLWNFGFLIIKFCWAKTVKCLIGRILTTQTFQTFVICFWQPNIKIRAWEKVPDYFPILKWTLISKCTVPENTKIDWQNPAKRILNWERAGWVERRSMFFKLLNFYFQLNF